MVDHKTQYKLNKKLQDARLAEFTNGNLEDDLSLARYLIERATNSGDGRLAAQLLNVVAKLTTADVSAGIAKNKYVRADVVRLFLEQFVVLVDESFRRLGLDDAVADAALERLANQGAELWRDCQSGQCQSGQKLLEDQR